MSAKVENGKVLFDKEDSAWGYVKGKCKWAKVTKPDDYGNFSISLYVDDEAKQHYINTVKGVADTAYAECTRLGKKPKEQDDFVKVDKEGNEFLAFKLEANKYGQDNKIAIFDKFGKEVDDFDQLIGNDSVVKIKYRAKPYFMSSSKVAGAGVRFFAIQIIDLVEYKAKGSGGFGDESGDTDEF